MPLALPKLRVGNPLRHKALSVFPLFADPTGQVDYRLADEALADESLIVEEVSESGSVPDLLVENKGDVRVLFIEGEELIGAKQNRILNTSVLVAAHSKTKIPVSCVEQGRWRYSSRHFGSSGSHSTSKMRRTLKASVSRSVKEKRGHRSDQAEVWAEVACLDFALGVDSGTVAMSDAFETYRDRIADYREHLKYVVRATGVAVAIGNAVVAVDVFDKPSTCQKIWDRLLSGVVLEALEAEKVEKYAQVEDVERLLRTTNAAEWGQAEAVGEGDEYRATIADHHASALTFGNTVVHASVAVEVPVPGA